MDFLEYSRLVSEVTCRTKKRGPTKIFCTQARGSGKTHMQTAAFIQEMYETGKMTKAECVEALEKLGFKFVEEVEKHD